ncbi:MAG: hypothetical protein ABIH23_30910, partial [bacterium]
GDGMYFYNYAPTITNSIIRGNGRSEIYQSGGSLTITWSNVPRSHTGMGNIDADPRFIRPWEEGSGDFHLMPDSPCVDAGNPDPSCNDRSRPPGLGTECCDMGAYGGPGNSGWPVIVEPTPIPEPVGVPRWVEY